MQSNWFVFTEPENQCSHLSRRFYTFVWLKWNKLGQSYTKAKHGTYLCLLWSLHGQNRIGLGLCCLMTPDLSKHIRCHVWSYLFQTWKSPDQTQSGAVSQVIAYEHFNLPQRFVWVSIYGLTYSLYDPGFMDKTGVERYSEHSLHSPMIPFHTQVNLRH